MTISAITGVASIADGSLATTGLFNLRYQQLQDNINSLWTSTNSVLGDPVSSNTWRPESGNTVAVSSAVLSATTGQFTDVTVAGASDITALVYVTDGTALPSSAVPLSRINGVAAVVGTSSTTQAHLAGVFHLKQTVATSATPQGVEGYVHSAHTTGTTVQAVATIGNIEHSGAGTLTTAKAIGAGVVLSGPGTITEAHGFDIAGGNRKISGATGSIGTYIGVAVGDLSTTGATTNYAIDCTNVLRTDYSSTTSDTRLLLWDVTAGTLKRVSIGAADSGGAGFKVLRVPN